MRDACRGALPIRRRDEVFFQHVGFVGVESIAVDPEYVQLRGRRPRDPETLVPGQRNRPAADQHRVSPARGHERDRRRLRPRRRQVDGCPASASNGPRSVTMTVCPTGHPGATVRVLRGAIRHPALRVSGRFRRAAPRRSRQRRGRHRRGRGRSRRPRGEQLSPAVGGVEHRHVRPSSVHRGSPRSGLLATVPAAICRPWETKASSAATFRRTELNGNHKQVRGSIDVPEGTRLLRVTMNGSLGTNAGPNNFDLFIGAGAAPSAGDFDLRGHSRVLVRRLRDRVAGGREVVRVGAASDG